ncbi:hypothetical protein [Synechococcus elongatus]|uniref:hypothetical protein n=1 Tax=Synechococcus elongatus TaxID=32046 RepID=UPI001863E8D4|nr:hypothetical protein [Synechococcus elongatus]
MPVTDEFARLLSELAGLPGGIANSDRGLSSLVFWQIELSALSTIADKLCGQQTAV